MKGRNLKVIKCCKRKVKSVNKSLKDAPKNIIPIKIKEIQKNDSINKKQKNKGIILQLLNDINNTEKIIKKQNTKLIQNEIFKNRHNNEINFEKRLNSKSKVKISNKSKSKSKSKNKSKNENGTNMKTLQIYKNPNSICYRNNSKKTIEKIAKPNLLTKQNRKINIITLNVKRNTYKKENQNEEQYKEIIKYTDNFYKDNKKLSIKSIDIPTNTNSDIVSKSSSLFINYKLGGETNDMDEFEKFSIKQIIFNDKSLNNVNENKLKEREIFNNSLNSNNFYSKQNKENNKINNCETFVLNKSVNNNNSYLLKTKKIFLKKCFKIENENHVNKIRKL